MVISSESWITSPRALPITGKLPRSEERRREKIMEGDLQYYCFSLCLFGLLTVAGDFGKCFLNASFTSP